MLMWLITPSLTHFLCAQEEEDAVQFANRVKSTIAQQGGLVDLAWCVKEFVFSCPANDWI